MELTQEYLKSIIDYSPETGVFKWRNTKRGRGSCVAGTSRSGSYTQITIDGVVYYGHRLAWLYVHGNWPRCVLDHKNRVKSDNRMCNLREATHSDNQQNRCASVNNTSGYAGVTWSKRAKSWQAQISVSNKRMFLGYHDTAKSAHEAYVAAKADKHKFHPIAL